jgi:recombination protein RecA
MAKDKKVDKKDKVKEDAPGMQAASGLSIKERQARILQLVKDIKKVHGEGSVFHGQNVVVKNVETTPTGSMILDVTSGIGGYPKGRVVEVYGPEGSGKTTICLSAVAAAQKAGMTCAYLDVEHALDIKYAQTLGVNVQDLLMSQPDNAEQALDLMKQMAESGAVGIIVLDSVAALVPKSELEAETIGDLNMGVVAKMLSRHFRVIAGILNKTNTIGLFVNQTRMKLGFVMGNPETTPGGNALKFFASMRLRVSRGKSLGGDPSIGHMLTVKFVKNKMASPFTECEVPLKYGFGVDFENDLFTMAKEWDIISGSAHTYFGETKLGSSRDEAVANLKSNKELTSKIEAAVRAKLKAKNEGTDESPIDSESVKVGEAEADEEGSEKDVVEE